ncbi:unnamed protein product [Chrysodeixis includens]|uniref:Actin maturation protease n=1 Tax=Chrysodeixis includens TaxID=689277 RepID=A0A9N8L4A8_CHRIL|nr:unnamed protein product [Chrysodeixis includens]
MCSIPPPPPPLPALADISPLPKEPSSNRVMDELGDACAWASEHRELREACIKSKIFQDKPPHTYKYRYFESISQIGPTCGLVALSMLVNGAVNPNELLTIAKFKGYTNNGEMFSCKQMVKLAEDVFSLVDNMENVRCELQSGNLSSPETIKRLINGAVLLVPYDADANHSPCLRNGHTAHWALVCGVIVTGDPVDEYDLGKVNVQVLCKHGKSKYLAVWNLYTLALSNKNLYEFSPKKCADGLVYILPEDGIGGKDGLRDQFLIFEGF